MNGVVEENRPTEYSLSKGQFKFICDTVYKTTGIVLDERKREMVYRRLMRRTRQLKLPSFDAYCQLLKDDQGSELPSFINAITTNLTSFFRESHHFDYIAEKFLPDHIKTHRHTKRLRIWSAACSTGEEPYSLAITLLDAEPNLTANWDAKILATDLDTEVLAKGQSGIYTKDRIDGLPKSMLKKWFTQGKGENADLVRVSPKLNEMITFNQLNLLHKWPMRGPFDLIICRNVHIYFDRQTQDRLIQRYHELLRPGGILILGHSESMSKTQTQFNLLGRTIFEKKAVREPKEGGSACY